jgi:hypothetical protein
MITIDLGSAIVTNVILIGLTALGWQRGFRWMLSIAFFITVGYVLTVQGGDFVVGLVNRIYTRMPQLVAFILGNDPGSVDPLPALVPENFSAPLLLRFLVFVALLAIGIGFTFPWEGKPLSGWQGLRPLRILGALTGLYIAVLSISAISIFWEQAAPALTLPELLARALSGLPTYAGIVPSAIAAFLITLIVVTVLRFNRIWATDVKK